MSGSRCVSSERVQGHLSHIGFSSHAQQAGCGLDTSGVIIKTTYAAPTCYASGVTLNPKPRRPVDRYGLHAARSSEYVERPAPHA